jgi:hypothetical protein
VESGGHVEHGVELELVRRVLLVDRQILRDDETVEWVAAFEALLTIAVVSITAVFAIVAVCELGMDWFSAAGVLGGWLRATSAASAMSGFT